MPTENSAMVTLVELEDDPTRTKGETRPNEPLMALAGNAGADPTNLNDARSHKDWPEWDASINWELEQHVNLRMWDLVEPPDGANIVGSRFVFHYKHDSSGKVAAYKTRLIAQGFSQAAGIDYDETFSPTTKLSTVRVIAAIAARHRWCIPQCAAPGHNLHASSQGI